MFVVVSAVRFAFYLTFLSSIIVNIKSDQVLDVSEELTFTTGCRGRGLNCNFSVLVQALYHWAILVPSIKKLMYIADFLKLRNVCPPTKWNIACDLVARYRTIDGSCNNLRNSTWGQAMQPLERWLQPEYEKGKWP